MNTKDYSMISIKENIGINVLVNNILARGQTANVNPVKILQNIGTKDLRRDQFAFYGGFQCGWKSEQSACCSDW